MKVKEPFMDYEPLRRRSGSKSAFDDTAGDFHFERPAEVRPREEKPAVKSTTESWIHKHGHTVSYAGIFLFSTLVFFRPYEFSPSLFWLAQTPFWVAVATLFVYAVTQLGLENRITARVHRERGDSGASLRGHGAR